MKLSSHEERRTFYAGRLGVAGDPWMVQRRSIRPVGTQGNQPTRVKTAKHSMGESAWFFRRRGGCILACRVQTIGGWQVSKVISEE
jgi:hypothetical protein